MKTRNKALLVALATLGLSACGGGGGSSSTSPASATQSVNQAPLVKFDSECTNERVCTLTSTSTDADGSIVSSLWRFPDGSTANGTEVSFTFAEYGSYSVSLTVTDNEGVSRTRSNTVGVFINLDNVSSYINKDHESIIFVQDFDHRPEGDYDIQKYREDICYNTDIDLYCGGFNSDDGITYEIVQGELKYTFAKDTTAGMSVNRLLRQNYQELYMTYILRFDEGFDFGGSFKLNGLFGAKQGEVAPTGGVGTSGPDGGFSSRYAIGGKGIKQYTYHPNQAGDYGDSKYVGNVSGSGRFEFKTGIIYTIEMRVKMNTPGEQNGEIETFINGISVLTQNDFSFSGSGVYGINQFSIISNFNQNNGFDNNSTIYVDNIVLSTERVVEAN